MSAPCSACGAPIDACADNLFANEFYYSLTSPETLGFVLNCPPGVNCLAQRTIYYLCCAHLLSAKVPANATAAQVIAVYRSLVAQCAALGGECGLYSTFITEHPILPTPVYFNNAVSCTLGCPLGQFTYTVPAGTFSGASQGDVDAQAQSYCASFAQPNCPVKPPPATPV